MAVNWQQVLWNQSTNNKKRSAKNFLIKFSTLKKLRKTLGEINNIFQQKNTNKNKVTWPTKGHIRVLSQSHALLLGLVTECWNDVAVTVNPANRKKEAGGSGATSAWWGGVTLNVAIFLVDDAILLFIFVKYLMAIKLNIMH